ncbi:MAG TPA: cytochrome c biogenesis protein CcdA [Bacteroidales bacterium]|nr:cytochrome c biogenesis protein CcdA [Bacteroidales bacterium]HOK73708.1 cytochrome c biogenesis protein CcdA [Bacteroidales bacterium]HOM40907.1 cytochrome c biogenesis protein CcdA [Bacteroidales bacterium]HPP91558.1 cytochrome c biogenesis protein CcdA [Bacteroidales bacterium]
MKKLGSLLLLFLLVFSIANSQVHDPVKWSFGYEKKNDNRYEIIFKASIEKGSHIYSMSVPPDGPVPTTISFESSTLYSLEGKPFEVTEPVEKFDEAFGFKIKTFSDSAEFRQVIVSSESNFTVKGTITYMSCTDAVCLPPNDIEFTVSVGEAGSENTETVAPSDIESGKKGIFGFFIASFLLGLVGLLTPCVYPMIPMTVAFFTREKDNRQGAVLNALIFGLSIVIIYTLPGLIITLTGAGAGFAGELSTHWIPNIVFFILFVVFAVSFFGAFEIILPNRWVSSADSKVDRGGLLASFFLALTTVIVSFSCTGPIAGSLLVEAASGDIIRPTIGMFAFGLAFSIPFTLFALFPSIMSKLPKSGAWLNSVKVVLAFLMLAFSMKFLSTIDSVYGLNIISREIFLAVWIVIFSLTGLYLMGKIRFPHDSEVKHIGVFRLFLIIVVFSFVLYMIPGLFGAELKGLSPLLPARKSVSSLNPAQYQGYNSELRSVTKTDLNINCSQPKYADRFQLPYGLTGYFEYNQGLMCAKEKGSPVLIDFKGHACANCKLMEAKVWSDPRVQERLRKFVIIALYTDDRTQLPEEEWITSSVDGKVKKTIGKINEDLEIMKFKTNAIPLYVITDYNGNPLVKPVATTLKVEEYIKWLDEGLRRAGVN